MTHTTENGLDIGIEVGKLPAFKISLIDEIEEYLFKEYNIIFSVEECEDGFNIIPDSYQELADVLNVDNQSNDFEEAFEDIKKDINSKFHYSI